MGLLRRRPPPFQLTGLVASPDGLFDGSFIVACARWWNHLIESDTKLARSGYAPFSTADADRLVGVPQPENRVVLEAVASSLSMPGRHSAAVLCLGYAFAVVVDAAVSRLDDDSSGTEWERGQALTEDDLRELERHYSLEGSAMEYDQWPPYWHGMQASLEDRAAKVVIASVRKSFDDQVDRWSVAEGFDLRRSIGAPDYALTAAEDLESPPTFPTWVDLLFEWGGRLRLAERLTSEGWKLADLRFSHDPTDFSDHLFDEAAERYSVLASQENPVSHDVELAVRMCGAWLGAELAEDGQLAITTTAVRGYLWRSVEQGPVGFLEPELTEAVERSRTVGNDRGPDEPFATTLYFAASQCMVDPVKTRSGSIGGWLSGPKHYERAFWRTTADFEDHGLTLDEKTRRQAFQFGVCVADVERVLRGESRPTLEDRA